MARIAGRDREGADVVTTIKRERDAVSTAEQAGQSGTEPKPLVRLHICPACHMIVSGNWTLDLRAKGRCTKRQHVAEPIRREYVYAPVAADAVAVAIADRSPGGPIEPVIAEAAVNGVRDAIKRRQDARG